MVVILSNRTPPSLPPSLLLSVAYLSLAQQNDVIKHGINRAAWLVDGDDDRVPLPGGAVVAEFLHARHHALGLKRVEATCKY